MFFLTLFQTPRNALLVLSLFLLGSCGGGGGGEGGTRASVPDSPDNNLNNAPIAYAGDDQFVAVGALVTLDAEGSNDPDSQPITYSWSIDEKPLSSAVALSRTDIVNPTFVADLAGTYEFRLVVNDGVDNSVSDTVMVEASEVNLAPVANAGDDQNIADSGLVTLDGSGSFDNNGDSFSFLWALVTKPSGSSAILDDVTSQSPSFTADLEGSYVIQLTVDDGELTSNPDSVTVTFEMGNQKPIARAGDDQVVSNALVQLDGSASTDPEGDGLTYDWSLVSRPNGSTAILSNSVVVDPTFIADIGGSYVWSLSVSDGELTSDPDSVTINYEPVNQRPTANAGPDQTVTNALVQLDGSGSSDPEGDDLSYSWSLQSRPAGSSSSLSNSSVVNPTFTADLEGEYIWSLVVNDGIAGSSASDSVSIDYSAPSIGSFIDNFDGSADRSNFVTNNASSLPDVDTTGGRYRANLVNNSGNITLHYHDDQGRLDAWLTRFPFEFIARNIGIGSQANSQTPHPYTINAFNFAGVQVHSTSLDSPNSAHVVVGHRGSSAQYTIEGKNTVNGSSTVNDIGSNVVPNARADIRIVGDTDGVVWVYWQLPNMNIGSQADSWIAYNGSGRLPGSQANFGGDGDPVYVGLITYAFNSSGIPFVGTCDSVEIIEN